jgi:hypothetical protein
MILISNSRSNLLRDLTWSLMAAVVCCGPLIFDFHMGATDHWIHYRWASQFVDTLSSGRLLPNWEANSRGGLGDPVFVYYPPLFYYGVAACTFLFGEVWLGTGAFLFILTTMLGYAGIRFAQSCGLSGWEARISGILFVMSPAALSVLGTINAYPWFMGYVLTSFLVMTAYRFFQKPVGLPQALQLAALVAALSLSHTLSTLTFLALFGTSLFLVLLVLHRGPMPIVSFGFALLAIMLGLGIAAFSLYPMLTTLDLVSPTGFLETAGRSWSNTFLLPVTTDNFKHSVTTIPVIPTIGMVIVLSLRRALEGRNRGELILILAAVTGFILATELSYPLWKSVEPLHYVQRPFRFFTVTSISITTLFVISIGAMAKQGITTAKWRRSTLTGVFTLCCLTLVILHGRTAVEILRYGFPETHEGLRAEFYVTPEHLPKGADDGWQDFLATGGWQAHCNREGLKCTVLLEGLESYNWHIETNEQANVLLPLMAYPAWSIHIDGLPAATTMEPANGLITVALGRGQHEITAEWQLLPEQRIGRWISLVALLTTLLLYFWRHLMRFLNFSAS